MRAGVVAARGIVQAADGPLTRGAVYEFRSMLAGAGAQEARAAGWGRRHLTPPFLGKGLLLRLRDAADVAWKLDLMLRGLAPELLLNTIEAERPAEDEAGIRLAIELGKVLSQLDPEAAAERDAMLRAPGRRRHSSSRR